MKEFRPVLFVVGALLTTLGAFMLIPALADASAGNPNWSNFLAASFLTVFTGVGLALVNRVGQPRFTVKQTFLLTTLSWTALTAFAALPFAMSDLGLSYADAFFEAMSGITTTGSTVIVGLDGAPKGILLWRALLQWQGGIGIIVMAIAVLPMLRVGGMQLFRTESSDRSDKVLPRPAQISTVIGLAYLILTLMAAVAYWQAGMTAFEAVCHAMTTISTAGFSTSDHSLGYFQSPAIEWLATIFMILGGLPFILYYRIIIGQAQLTSRETQVHCFLVVIGFSILAIVLTLVIQHNASLETALRHAAFNVVSIITGTGYSSTDYGAWGGIAVSLIFFLMLVGGCTGSTTGGIKIFRLQVMAATAWVQIRRPLQPHGIFIPHFNRKPIPEPVAEAVTSFLFVFVACFVAITLGLGALGLDFITSMSGAATALANVGPGLGHIIGPSGTFAPLPDAAKWLLSFAMLLGRLELFTVLVLFMPSFWRS